MRAYLTKTTGWYCGDSCEETITDEPEERTIWRADTDYKIAGMSDYDWHYYSVAPVSETAWACPNCGQYYADRPSMEPLWQCGHCKDYYTEESDARDCCQ